MLDNQTTFTGVDLLILMKQIERTVSTILRFRLVLIEVLDVLGRSAPAIGVTVAYVGENINPPVIDIKRK